MKPPLAAAAPTEAITMARLMVSCQQQAGGEVISRQSSSSSSSSSMSHDIEVSHTMETQHARLQWQWSNNVTSRAASAHLEGLGLAVRLAAAAARLCDTTWQRNSDSHHTLHMDRRHQHRLFEVVMTVYFVGHITAAVAVAAVAASAYVSIDH